MDELEWHKTEEAIKSSSRSATPISVGRRQNTSPATSLTPKAVSTTSNIVSSKGWQVSESDDEDKENDQPKENIINTLTKATELIVIYDDDDDAPYDDEDFLSLGSHENMIIVTDTSEEDNSWSSVRMII